nr:PetG [Trichosanthes cordata]
MISVFIF